jgi:hypothetical protein
MNTSWFIIDHGSNSHDKRHDVEGVEKLILVTGHDSTAEKSIRVFSQNNQRRKMEFELALSNVASASATGEGGSVSSRGSTKPWLLSSYAA